MNKEAEDRTHAKRLFKLYKNKLIQPEEILFNEENLKLMQRFYPWLFKEKEK